jgi:zinc protease
MKATPPSTRKGAGPSLPGPDDVQRSLLSNGVVVLSRSNFNSPSVVVSGYLPAGSQFEADEQLGLASFTASALLRGTARRDFQAIYDDLESNAASLGFSASVHTTSFSGRALAEDLPLLLGLLAEALREPVFPPDQVEKLRAQILTGLAIRSQDTAEMASLTFDQLIFDGHPYSRPEDGWPETVRGLTRNDLAAFHRRHYGPGGMVIAVVGAVGPERAVQAVQDALGEWSNPDQPEVPELPPPGPLEADLRRHVSIPGKSQSDIVIGARGPRRREEDFLPASLGNSVLGQFGMMGRIGESVRERSGLAYYAYSSLSAGIGPGSWEVSAGVNPANVAKTLDLVRQEIQRFVQQGVTSEELGDSQANFIGRLPLSLESNAGVAGALLNIERYDLGLDYYQRYPDLVRAVTPEAVLETARKYLDPGRLAVATAGPENS